MRNGLAYGVPHFPHFETQESGLLQTSVISWYESSNINSTTRNWMDGSAYLGFYHSSNTIPSSTRYHPYPFSYHDHAKKISHTLDHAWYGNGTVYMSGWVQSDTCLEFDATRPLSDSPPTTVAGPSLRPSFPNNEPANPSLDALKDGHINVANDSIIFTGAPSLPPPPAFSTSMTISPSSSPSHSEATTSCDSSKTSTDNADVVGEVKYSNRVCQICHKRFDRPSTLKKHMVVHTHSQPYHCTLCPARFGVKSNLSRHIRHSHSNTISNDNSSTPQPNNRPQPRTRARSLTEPTKMPSPNTRRRSRQRAASMPPVPTTLRRFRTLTAEQCQKRVVPVAVPAQRFSEGFWEDNDYFSEEERNSWDMDVDDVMPYHPDAYRGTLPGPNAMRIGRT